ncbi:MAG: ABC transporter ATP-binding protein [Olegusella sp.]|nr:ABC transporter ATP-binding protein [Olegusella sp.]
MLRLARYLRHYKKECVLAPLFKLLEALFGLIVPLIMAQVIDVGVAQGDRAYILQRGGLLVAMGLLGMLVAFTAQYFAARLAAGFGAELRGDLFRHIMGLARTDIDALGNSTLVTRVTNDTQQVQDGVNMFFRLVLRSPFVVGGALVLVFAIDGTEGLVYTLTIVVILAVVTLVMRIATRLYRSVQRRLDDVLLRTSENLEGVRVIRAFRREADEVSRMDETAGDLRREQVHVGDIAGTLSPLTYAVCNLGLAIALYVGGFKVDVGGLTQGQLVAFVNYSAQILVEGVKLANLIVQESKSAACAARINQVFDTQSSMRDGTLDAACEEPAVVFDDVTFSYADGAAPALSHVSFSAAPGETIGVIGGTGSGKSTLAALIMRFYDTTGGAVRIGSHDVRDFTLASLRRTAGIVEQGARLFSGTIASNLRWGDPDATDADLERAIAIAQAGDVVASKGGLAGEVEQLGRNFSGGQRQRLTIARTLVRKPRVLVLDDSSSALDFATDAALRTALHRDLAGTTVFLISQRVTSIQSADRICVLDHGRLAGWGTHDELLASCPVYQEIYASQVKGGRHE